MNRFRCVSSLVKGNEVAIIDPGQLHHLKVLRIEPGEDVVVFDESGNEYECRVTSVMPEKAVLAVRGKLEKQTVSTSITVAVAIPKKSRIDDIVDKLTQVGVDRIIPLMSDRVIVRPDARDREARHRRWEKIAEAATLQSQRNTVPRVDPVTSLSGLLKNTAAFSLKLIPTLEGDRLTLKEALSRPVPDSVLVLIGPEGDFSPAETAAARSAGFIPVSFGRNVLRVETAAVYACSVIAFYYRN